MRNRSLPTLLVVLWFISLTPASSQTPATTPPQPEPVPALDPRAQEEADHEALRGFRTIYEQAIRENKIELLQPHLHSDFHGVMVTSRPVNSFAELQQFWRDLWQLIGEGGSYTTTLKPELSTIMGDVALARGSTDDVVRTSQGEYQFITHWSAVLQREGGAWKIRYVQGTMDPVGNPFVREFTQRALIRTGSVAAVVGIVGGAIVGMFWQRRRRARMA